MHEEGAGSGKRRREAARARRRIDEKMRSDCVYYRDKGTAVWVIAKVVGISESSVYRILREDG